MIKSMTGFGRGKCGDFVVEVKSVNHRFLEIPLRGLKFDAETRELIKKRIKSAFSRGSFEVLLSNEAEGKKSEDLSLDKGVVEKLVAFSEELKSTYRVPGSLSVDSLLNFQGAVVLKEGGESPDEVKAQVDDALQLALVEMNSMKETEGGILQKDLSSRLTGVAGQVDAIEREMPLLFENYVKRFRARIGDLAGNVEVDENRLAGEIAVLADKSDISEELTRLKSHISQFERAFENNPPVGKRLDFILQEMNREANTIGSKAIDTFLTEKVVEIKTELERMKEQVQNVE
ncbi:MAG: YicC/YloC family endoribonuclease [Nitrospinota bacterium]